MRIVYLPEIPPLRLNGTLNKEFAGDFKGMFGNDELWAFKNYVSEITEKIGLFQIKFGMQIVKTHKNIIDRKIFKMNNAFISASFKGRV